MKKRLVSLLLCVMLAVCAIPAFAEGIALTDMAGRTLTLTEPLERVVVLQPADAEILCALGAEGVIVGRGEYVNYPETMQSVPTVASGAETNVEAILALEPQAVVMTVMSQTKEQIAALEQAGVQVIVTDAQDIEGIYTAIALLGAAVGKDAEAQALTASMRDRLAAVAEKAAKADLTGKTVYFEISPLPYGIWTAGQHTFMDELATLCGVKNIFHDLDGWPSVSPEQVIALNPDYIVTTTNYEVNGMAPLDEIAGRDGWADISAIAAKRLYVADNDAITRPGPRLADAAEDFLAFLMGE